MWQVLATSVYHHLFIILKMWQVLATSLYHFKDVAEKEVFLSPCHIFKMIQRWWYTDVARTCHIFKVIQRWWYTDVARTCHIFNVIQRWWYTDVARTCHIFMVIQRWWYTDVARTCHTFRMIKRMMIHRCGKGLPQPTWEKERLGHSECLILSMSRYWVSNL